MANLVDSGEILVFICETLKMKQGWRQKFSDRGAGASDKGAKMIEKLCFRALFSKIPPTRTQSFFRWGAVCLR